MKWEDSIVVADKTLGSKTVPQMHELQLQMVLISVNSQAGLNKCSANEVQRAVESPTLVTWSKLSRLAIAWLLLLTRVEQIA